MLVVMFLGMHFALILTLIIWLDECSRGFSRSNGWKDFVGTLISTLFFDIVLVAVCLWPA